jgi:BirA family biotin operon repressor/biotin-[acetyl-CoA-carboxylase] ligase
MVHHHAVTDSTNLSAANLPAWHAVRADRQRAGRGRYQRSWISDQGGLWLSAVVPIDKASADWQALPLAVGLAVANTLSFLGVHDFRLRWPNDVLVHNRKLAGLLVEQFLPGLAVAGIGINVTNQPEIQDPALKDQTTRVADLLSQPPSLSQLTEMLLDHLMVVVEKFEADGFASLVPAINELWGGPRRVELDLDGRLVRGLFTGIGNLGELNLTDDSGLRATYLAHQVRHLKEIQ